MKWIKQWWKPNQNETAPDACQPPEALQEVLEAMKSLPAHEPSERVWKHIEQEVANSPAPGSTVWLPMRWLAPVAGVALLTAMLWGGGLLPWQESNPSYQVIEVTDAPDYEGEAEFYLVHHDLAEDSPDVREQFLAFYEPESAE